MLHTLSVLITSMLRHAKNTNVVIGVVIITRKFFSSLEEHGISWKVLYKIGQKKEVRRETTLSYLGYV